jgi:cathepsin C
MRKITCIVLPLLLFYFVSADLPVHCVKHQIVGEWTLQLSKPAVKGNKRTKFINQGHGILTCGHDIPDSEATSYLAGESSFKAYR